MSLAGTVGAFTRITQGHEAFVAFITALPVHKRWVGVIDLSDAIVTNLEAALFQLLRMDVQRHLRCGWQERLVVVAELLQSIAVLLDDVFFGPVLEDEVAGTKRREVHFGRIPHVMIWVSTLDLLKLGKSPLELALDGLVGSHATHHWRRGNIDSHII